MRQLARGDTKPYAGGYHSYHKIAVLSKHIPIFDQKGASYLRFELISVRGIFSLIELCTLQTNLILIP